MLDDCPIYLKNIGMISVWDRYINYGSGYGMIVIDSCIDNNHVALQTGNESLIEKFDSCILEKPLRGNFKDEDSFNNAIHRFPHGTAIAGIILGRESVYNSIKVCGIDLSNNIKIFAYDAFRKTAIISLFENSLDKENLETTSISHFSKSGKEIWKAFKRSTLISSASLVTGILLSKKEWTDLAEGQCSNSQTILVTAAGNDGVDLDNHKDGYFPANLRFKSTCYDFVIRVGSLEYDSKNIPQKSNHSNYSSKTLDILAPGKNIAVIQPYGKVIIDDGTSYAAPIVTATIEMMLKCRPNATSVKVKEALFNSADKYDHLKMFVKEGRVLNIEKAIDSFCIRMLPKKVIAKDDSKSDEL